MEDLDQIQGLELLTIFAFEQYNVHIKRTYLLTLQRRGSPLKEIVRIEVTSVKKTEEGLVASREEKMRSTVEKQNQICRTRPFLVLEGWKKTLRSMERTTRKKEAVGRDGEGGDGPGETTGKNTM